MLRNLELLLKSCVFDFALLLEDEEKQINTILCEIEYKHLNYKTDYIKFIEEYNKIRQTKYTATPESRNEYYKNEGLFSFQERINALKNILTDTFYKDKQKMLTPQYVCKNEIINKYMNFTPSAQPEESSNNEFKNKNYDIEL